MKCHSSTQRDSTEGGNLVVGSIFNEALGQTQSLTCSTDDTGDCANFNPNLVFFKFYTSFSVCTISRDASPARRNTLLWCSELHYAEKLSVIYSKRQQLRVWNWGPLAEWFPGEAWISLHSWVLVEFMLLKWKPARQEIVMKPSNGLKCIC